jgi:truncated hemoglobin YjbI
MDDLEAMGPPKEWKTELKEYAEDVAKSVTNGENTKF